MYIYINIHLFIYLCICLLFTYLYKRTYIHTNVFFFHHDSKVISCEVAELQDSWEQFLQRVARQDLYHSWGLNNYLGTNRPKNVESTSAGF